MLLISWLSSFACATSHVSRSCRALLPRRSSRHYTQSSSPREGDGAGTADIPPTETPHSRHGPADGCRRHPPASRKPGGYSAVEIKKPQPRHRVWKPPPSAESLSSLGLPQAQKKSLSALPFWRLAHSICRHSDGTPASLRVGARPHFLGFASATIPSLLTLSCIFTLSASRAPPTQSLRRTARERVSFLLSALPPSELSHRSILWGIDYSRPRPRKSRVQV